MADELLLELVEFSKWHTGREKVLDALQEHWINKCSTILNEILREKLNDVHFLLFGNFGTFIQLFEL